MTSLADRDPFGFRILARAGLHVDIAIRRCAWCHELLTDEGGPFREVEPGCGGITDGICRPCANRYRQEMS